MIIRLQAIIPETAEVQSFIFAPEDPLTWQAGQSIRLELPVGYDLHERRFTIASAPHEGVLRITTRRSDSLFKKALWSLKVGDIVQAFSIEGDFVWKPAPRYVFLAGGLGITPFRALLNAPNSKSPIELIHSAKGGHVFAEEFLAKHHAGEIIYQQLHERIAGSSIPFYGEAHYYIAGPRGMVKAVVAALRSNAIEQHRIIQDVFTGY
ncbi:MAG TPA: FAD-dependent oxidoreductase [Candidatus Saccharimonadales bacterium]